MNIELSKKLQLLWKSKTRYFILTGGRGSGKSFGVSLFLLDLINKANNKVLFTRYTLTSAKISIIPEFTEKIYRLFGSDVNYEITQNEIINKSTKSSILFKGIKTSSGNQTAALKSLQGVNTWVLDEADELVDEDIFDKIDLSIRSKNATNRIILILNPSYKSHWIYKRFFLQNSVYDEFTGIKNDVTYIHTTYKDNIENLDESFLKRIAKIREENYNKFCHVVLGRWIDVNEGVIFKNWQFGDINESIKPVFGLDVGFSIDETVLVEVRVDEAIKTLYVRCLFAKTRLTTKEIAERLQKFCGQNLIVIDSSEPRLIEELSTDYKLNVIASKKGKDSIRNGILKILDYKIIVAKEYDFEFLEKELLNYAWSDKEDNKPVDAFNHSIDAMRYAFDFANQNYNTSISLVRTANSNFNKNHVLNFNSKSNFSRSFTKSRFK